MAEALTENQKAALLEPLEAALALLAKALETNDKAYGRAALSQLAIAWLRAADFGRLEERLAQVTAALQTYGTHLKGHCHLAHCNSVGFHAVGEENPITHHCTCGLDTALAPSREETT